MTIQELNRQMQKLFKGYLRAEKIYDTGALHDSIYFNCTDDGNMGIKINFNALYYIQFVRHGVAVEKFFTLNDTKKLLKQYTIEAIELNLSRKT